MFKWLIRFFYGPQVESAHELCITYKNDIIKISQWIERNIIYYKDVKPQDEWQLPSVTIKRKAGDCEDFAVLYSTIFSVLGWPHSIYVGYPKKGPGHAICVAESPKGFVYTSNASFILTNESDYISVVKKIMPDMILYRRTDSLGITVETI